MPGEAAPRRNRDKSPSDRSNFETTLDSNREMKDMLQASAVEDAGPLFAIRWYEWLVEIMDYIRTLVRGSVYRVDGKCAK